MISRNQFECVLALVLSKLVRCTPIILLLMRLNILVLTFIVQLWSSMIYYAFAERAAAEGLP